MQNCVTQTRLAVGRCCGVLCTLLLVGYLTACRTEPAEPELFQSLDSTKTGIGFINQLRETDSLSILDYLYFYNGAGVAAGDLNGDGLSDLYFVSSQGPNKLYLNKGNMAFRDVTTKANVAGKAGWQTGVTMADVNGDGRLDIYVSAVSKFRGLTGTNELYINNGPGPDGVPTFTEQAAAYGLNFAGFSTQAAFFDYDHDGDLDCFLLNHAVHTSRSYDNVSARSVRVPESGDYLFKNQLVETGKPTFTDVSEQAGIFGAAMGYGLGIAVADLNNDGWEDMYVSNDFHEDDYYYINDQHGHFRESVRQAFGHTSRFSMGNDAADVNNDGYPDLMTLDMYPADEVVEKSSQGEDALDVYRYKLSYGYMDQYSRNCLQLNLSGKQFMDVGLLAGVAATDWSWSPLLADYDNDGQKDLFIANGIVRRPNNLDYVKYISSDSVQSRMNTSAGTFNEQDLAHMPSGKVHNYLFRGGRNLQFTDKSLTWGFETPTFSCGAAYADLDNDGDLDLVTNNIADPAGVYQNQARTLFPANQYLKIKLAGQAPNTFGVGAKVILYSRDTVQVQQLMPTRGFESAVEPVLTFGVGTHKKLDSVAVIWPNQQVEVRRNVAANQTLTLRQADARAIPFLFPKPAADPLFTVINDTTLILYRHRENVDYYDFTRESLMPFKLSTEGPKLATADVNGDGLLDVYIGGARRQAGSLLLQTLDGRFTNSAQPAFLADADAEDTGATFFDADGDGDADLYVVTGGNEFYGPAPELADRLYINDGKGQFTRRPDALPPMFSNKSCARPADVDHDGDLDLFVGGRVVGFAYGKTPDSYLLINDGKGRFTDQTASVAPALKQVGMVTDAVWADTDNDKDLDLIVAGDWMPVRVFANDGGKLTEVENPFNGTPMNGFWQCLAAADFDRDGDIDLIAGNLGLNTRLRKGADIKLHLWVKDLDNNKTNDPILAYNVLDHWYPTATKDELGKQVPSIINRRYTNYADYAGQTVEQLFSQGELTDAEERDVNQLASVYLENQYGKFVVHTLPVQAQVSKLFTLLPLDIDHDGDLDVVGGGNFYGASMYQGRYDASYGLVLRNDGKRSGSSPQFTSLSPVDTGLLLSGEVRDMVAIPATSGTRLIMARNNAPVQLVRLKPAGNQ
ncbi:VCBS repeat-containing protein [Spirosoma rhododendri]|uniref:VCBS repeat-containing protein n=1 Tax=Spirosoma rhododendri TaxID=2728024 RepID=A0A7L5DRW2_9BACT|nr:VCBS repeat-containing protein [Spirosoma rhododendri]QJD81234.1 VCBS repeat-containing protein [Spirosoma rhododendri]